MFSLGIICIRKYEIPIFTWDATSQSREKDGEREREIAEHVDFTITHAYDFCFLLALNAFWDNTKIEEICCIFSVSWAIKYRNFLGTPIVLNFYRLFSLRFFIGFQGEKKTSELLKCLFLWASLVFHFLLFLHVYPIEELNKRNVKWHMNCFAVGFRY